MWVRMRLLTIGLFDLVSPRTTTTTEAYIMGQHADISQADTTPVSRYRAVPYVLRHGDAMRCAAQWERTPRREATKGSTTHPGVGMEGFQD
jgi:hypothetical protein